MKEWYFRNSLWMVVWAWVILIPGSNGVDGASTQEMRIEGSSAWLEGKFFGTGLNGLGELVLGYQPSRTTPVEDAAHILSSAVYRGKVYFGSGLPGTVLTFDGKAASVLTRLPNTFAVTALASDGRHLFAATLPAAAIYKIDEKGETTLFADFSTGSASPNYVWALAVYKSSLYAALGGHFPSVYRLDLKTAKKELIHQVEGKVKNVTAMMVTDDGIFFGDDAGRVLRRSHGGADGRARVLYAFSDAEIRSIAPFAQGLAVAVNSRRFIPPAPPPPPPAGKDQSKPPEEGVAEEEFGDASELKKALEAVAASIEDRIAKESSPAPLQSKPAPPPKPESPAVQSPVPQPAFSDPFGKGEGNLFWMSKDGSEVHRLWYSPSSVVLSIHPEDAHPAWAGAQAVWVATSNPGRLYQVTRAGSEHLFFESTSKDLSVVTAGPGKHLVAASSNPAILYELDVAGVGEYSTKIFDMGFPARLGRPDIFGAGSGGVGLLVRSGSTTDVDSGWSEYEPLQADGAPQGSGRFFQMKARFKSPETALRRIRIPYRTQNIQPRLMNLSVEVVRSQDGSADGRDIRFQWDVTNLDNDVLLYQMFHQPPRTNQWISLFEPMDRPRGVKTVSVPADQFSDGVYRFRMDVTDEVSNGPAESLTHQAEFPLILLDQTPPSATLRLEGSQVRWEAVDAASRISRVEYRLDGGIWRSALPDDGLYDASSESGRIALSDHPGAGMVDIRTFDERANSRIQSLSLK